MSIIIKGMEMPENCFLCPLSVLSDNRLFCELTSDEVVRAKIDSDCPLIELPPHGRLIDADALPRIKFHDLPYPHITPSDVDAESYERGWNDVIDAIVGDEPIIIEAEGETE